MYLQFDKNKLHLQVLVGILEKYEPTDKHKDLQEKVSKLRAELEKFQSEVIFPSLAEIEKEVKEENDRFVKPKDPPG